MFLDTVKSPAVNYYDLDAAQAKHYFAHPSGLKEPTIEKAGQTLKNCLKEAWRRSIFLMTGPILLLKYIRLLKIRCEVFMERGRNREKSERQSLCRAVRISRKDSKMVSSFETQGQTDREQFINALEFMSRHKKWAHAISKRKDMNLGDRIDYVEHHGMNVYGSVVTGPTKEIERLLKNKTVKASKHR